MNKDDKTMMKDIMTGVATAVISFVILSFFKFYIAMLVIAPLPLIAGIIRGKNREGNRLLKVILMNLLFFLLLMAIMDGMFHLLLIVAIALTGTYTGIYIRQNFKESMIKSVGFAVLYGAAVLFSGLILVRYYFDASMWKEKNAIAPEYELMSFEGDTIRSRDHDRKVVVLDFWATWCAPCKKQFPVFEEIYKKYKEDDNVVFLTVNSAMGGDTFEKAEQFITENSYSLPFVFDIQGETSKKFAVSSIPSIIIIDKKGVIRLIHKGYEESEHFERKFVRSLENLLKEE